MPYVIATVTGSFLFPIAVVGTIGYFGYKAFSSQVAANNAASEYARKQYEAAGDPVNPANFGK